jgi:hypothetical protein
MKNGVRLVNLDVRDGELVEISAREINPRRCPHLILVGEHYRDDGSCKCDDPNEKIMKKWGYKWRNGAWRGKDLK